MNTTREKSEKGGKSIRDSFFMYWGNSRSEEVDELPLLLDRRVFHFRGISNTPGPVIFFVTH